MVLDQVSMISRQIIFQISFPALAARATLHRGGQRNADWADSWAFLFHPIYRNNCTRQRTPPQQQPENYVRWGEATSAPKFSPPPHPHRARLSLFIIHRFAFYQSITFYIKDEFLKLERYSILLQSPFHRSRPSPDPIRFAIPSVEVEQRET